MAMSSAMASRTVAYESRDGQRRDVRVDLGAPAPAPDQGDAWACEIRIAGFGTPVVRAIYGIDSMQALVLALHLLPTELLALARRDGGRYLDEPHLGLDHACRVHLGIRG